MTKTKQIFYSTLMIGGEAQNRLKLEFSFMSFICKCEKDFIHLLNFLDFMETIGYIENKDHVTYQELNALCGESLIFNYKIFQKYISNKRTRHSNQRFYINFEQLFGKLEEEKKRNQLKVRNYWFSPKSTLKCPKNVPQDKICKNIHCARYIN